MIDIELFDLKLALIVGGCHGMFDLELGIEYGSIIETVADAENGARQVKLRVLREMRWVRVVDLAVTPQAQILGNAARGGARRLDSRNCRAAGLRRFGGPRRLRLQ